MLIRGTWECMRFQCFGGLFLSSMVLIEEVKTAADPISVLNSLIFDGGLGVIYSFLYKTPPHIGLINIGFYLWCLFVVYNDRPVYLLLHMFINFVINAMSLYLLFVMLFVLEKICWLRFSLHLVNCLMQVDYFMYYKLKYYDPYNP